MLNEYGVKINPCKVIDRDLKVCPWLKVFNYNELIKEDKDNAQST